MSVPINNIEQFRPMLSASLPSSKANVPTDEQVMRDLKRLDWSQGFLVSPKMDGIRAVNHPSLGLVSRTLKPIPNRFIQQTIRSLGSLVEYNDGELISGKIEDFVGYNDCQSQIMSEAGSREFTYCLFDTVAFPDKRFDYRNRLLKEQFESRMSQEYNGVPFHVEWLHQKLVMSIEELLEVEAEAISLGYEGVIMRHPAVGYKNGRSTFLQQGMIKLKRFIDAEAKIIGFEELKRNTNEPTIDKLGYQKRSAHLAGKLAANTLGKFVVEGINGEWTGVQFECGSGLDDATRDLVWRNRDAYLGKLIKYKYQASGSKDKPRSPIFLGFRHAEDM